MDCENDFEFQSISSQIDQPILTAELCPYNYFSTTSLTVSKKKLQMTTLFLTIAFLFRPSIIVGHPIIGTWEYSKNSCIEAYTFGTDGIRQVKSNEELVTAEFEITDIDEAKGVYLLRDRVLTDNGKVDCSGSTDNMIGDVVEVYIHIKDKPKRFNFCFDDALSKCVGPFLKRN